MGKANPVRLKRNIRLGELDAESDHDLLSSCFVESEILDDITNTSKPASIIVGRVGAGKSALLHHVKQHGHRHIWLDPRALAFHYIENSTILKFVESLGVNLNTFYKLLWRHVLVVELLKARYELTDQNKQASFLGRIESIIGNTSKKKALSYVRTWGDRFWQETEQRVKEVTQKIEKDLGASIGSDFSSLSGAQRLSREQSEEIRYRANRVVDSIQIRELSEVLNLLNEDVFDDPQKVYYVLIDDLDQNWASTETRCRLIRALIEEIKTFRRLENVKIIIALRRDLLEMVYDKTRDSGFQEEKYESLIAPLLWTKEDLRSMIDLRIRAVFERQYSNADVGIGDLFPQDKGGGESAIDYMLQRTLRRPRDMIQFANIAMNAAANKSHVSWNDIKQAENTFSTKRLTSLFEEWSDIYPALPTTVEILRGAPHQFSRSYLKENHLQRIIGSLFDGPQHDPCAELARQSTDPKARITESDILSRILRCLYQVGAIGIKPDSNSPFLWSYLNQPSITESEVKRSEAIQVHKMLWQSLNIIPKNRLIEKKLS